MERKQNSGRRGMVRRGVVAAVALLLLIMLLLSSTHVRIALQSAVFLNEVFPDAPAYPGRWFAGEPYRLLVQFRHEDEYKGAYLYRPAEKRCHGGIVMYIGLGPEHGDPHLDRISRAFARSGISVLIPVSESMVDYRVAVDEHLIAASAFEYLQSMPEIHPERVGMFGISVGGSVVANAAQEDRIRDDVAMVHSLGGYFDAQTLLAHMAVRAFEIDGEWEDWEPSSTTFRATRNSIVPLLPSDDRVEIWNLFDEDVSQIPDELTAEGRALAAILANRDPHRLDELLAEMPEEISAYLRKISPSDGVENLQADVFLLHDKFDHVLPYSESVRFAGQLEEHGHDDVHLTIIEQFHHVRPDEEGDRLSLLGDGLRLYRHIYRLFWSMDDRGWLSSPLDILPFVHGPEHCGA